MDKGLGPKGCACFITSQSVKSVLLNKEEFAIAFNNPRGIFHCDKELMGNFRLFYSI